MRAHFKRRLTKIARLLFHKGFLFPLFFVGSVSMVSVFYLLQWNIICLNIDIEARLNNLVSISLTFGYLNQVETFNLVSTNSVQSSTRVLHLAGCANLFVRPVKYLHSLANQCTKGNFQYSQLFGTKLL